MLSKKERQRAILELVHRELIATQVELQSRLRGLGVDADQATLSRDIKELRLVKVPSEDGHRYTRVNPATSMVPIRPEDFVARFVRSAEPAGQLVVLKTDPGNASPVAGALDHLAWDGIVGTVAGDNTVFVACAHISAARKIARHIENMRKGS